MHHVFGQLALVVIQILLCILNECSVISLLFLTINCLIFVMSISAELRRD